MSARVLGVDVGGSRIKLGAVGRDGTLSGERALATPPGGRPAALVEAVADAVSDIAAGQGVTFDGVGVSVAGFVDPARARMVYNPNLPELAGFPLRDALEARLAVPCCLEVDSNAGALAEARFGAGRGARRLLVLVVGTGVGGAVLLDGAPLRFCGGCAGDIGHVIVVPGGRRCTCGAHGCLEAEIGVAALEARGGRPVRSLIAAAVSGDGPAAIVLAEAGARLGLGLASLASLFEPDRIVVGGGIAEAGEALLGPARASFRDNGAPRFSAQIALRGAELGAWAGVIGAAVPFLDGPAGAGADA